HHAFGLLSVQSGTCHRSYGAIDESHVITAILIGLSETAACAVSARFCARCSLWELQSARTVVAELGRNGPFDFLAKYPKLRCRWHGPGTHRLSFFRPWHDRRSWT